MEEDSSSEVFCGKCKHTITYEDKICRYCGNDFSEVGKDLKFHVPVLSIGLTTEIEDKLNEPERKFVTKLGKWFKKNVGELSVSSIEVGFPSGITIVFGKKTK